MKRQWVALLAVAGGIVGSSLTAGFNSSVAIAQQPNCQNETQMALNQCAALNAEAADRRLNQVYQQVQAKYQESQLSKLLTDAEAAWIKYRDASCKFSESRFAGGSIVPMVYSNCLEKLAKQRTQELESYLRDGYLN